MTEFICADIHFNHSNIIKYENRPFADKDEMNRKLIENWNSTVKNDDIVWVLGDVAFASKEVTKELVSQLNGRKRLIMGNHDRARNESFWRDCGFEFVSRWPIIYQKNVVLMHEPPILFGKDTSPYFHVYGHVHGDAAFPNHTDCSACVSIERLNYRPAPLQSVLNGTAYKERNT